MLLDVATVVAAGEEVQHVRVSPNGRYVAYTVTTGGSRSMELRIYDRVEERDLLDRIPGLKFDPPWWTADSRGLVYYRYLTIGEDGVDRDSVVLHHSLGQPVERDTLLARSDPGEVGATTWVRLSDDARFVVVIDDFAGQQRLSILDLGQARQPNLDGPLVALSESRDGRTEFLGNVGSKLYLKTSRDAPNFRVVAVDLARPMHWQTVIAESQHLLQHARVADRKLVAAYRQDIKSSLEIYDLGGRFLRTVPLPAMGSVYWLSAGTDAPNMTFAFDSFAYPRTLFRYDLRSGTTQRLEARATEHDPEDFVTEQRFFQSKDGTRVPMFVTYRVDRPPSPDTPLLLYGYGASGAIEEPGFYDEWFAWLEAGGTLAVANVRGGGEYGDAWWHDGRLERKQNSFDDFIAAAEALLRDGSTSRHRLAIHGSSNGGLLVAATLTQRPELFAAAVPAVAVLDALRFPSFTAGPRWAAEHGDPTIPEQFDWLYSWSPLHRIEDGGCYPPTLVLTAANDDIVHPSQSFKFAARMQAAESCEAPLPLRVYESGGHSLMAHELRARADMLAFIAEHTGLETSQSRARGQP